MAERERLQDLVREFGQLVGVADLGLDEDGQCALVVDDGLVVQLEYGEERDQLLLLSLLGEPQGAPAAVYEQLLRANYLTLGTGGATLGLQPGGSGIVLSMWLPKALDFPRFTKAIEAFVNYAEEWTQRLPELGATADVSDADFQTIRG